MGRTGGRYRGLSMATYGEIPMAAVTHMTRTRGRPMRFGPFRR
jgi:hypothetical protein